MQLFRHIAVLAALSIPNLALAQEAAAPKLAVELNAADNVGESCRLTFVLRNSLQQDVDKLVAETVLFSDQGQVVLLTLFDFGKLPVGRPRVRQFQIPETSCDRLSQVLVNGTDTCDGPEPGTCEAAMSLSSRVAIALEG